MPNAQFHISYSYLTVAQMSLSLFLSFQLSVLWNHFTAFCSPCTKHSPFFFANSYKITSICNLPCNIKAWKPTGKYRVLHPIKLSWQPIPNFWTIVEVFECGTLTRNFCQTSFSSISASPRDASASLSSLVFRGNFCAWIPATGIWPIHYQKSNYRLPYATHLTVCIYIIT